MPRTQDYFTGEIHMFGKKIMELNGNYMGYMDVGGMRYFDIRLLDKIYFPVSRSLYINCSQIASIGDSALPSDSTKRSDSISLRDGDALQAQKSKEELEHE